MKWKLGEDYKTLDKEIAELDEELRHCWTRLTSPRRNFSSVRTKDISDALGNGVAMAVDMESELHNKIEELKKLRLQIEDIIDAFPGDHRRLLRMRYIRSFTWQQIANRMYCDESTCRRTHRQIIKSLQI